MHWKEEIKRLEQEEKWDIAIEFLQQIIQQNPDDHDPYLFLNFLIMELLVERDHDESKHDYYAELLKKYFDESYAKFSYNAEYLYITAKTAVMGEWFFGIEQKDYEAMIERAKQLDPDNLVYKENYYWDLHEKNPAHPELIAYVKAILMNSSPVKEQLKSKGSVGEYLIGMKEQWCEDILCEAVNLPKSIKA